MSMSTVPCSKFGKVGINKIGKITHDMLFLIDLLLATVSLTYAISNTLISGYHIAGTENDRSRPLYCKNEGISPY